MQRVDSNDTFCAGHGNGKFPAFGPFGYQLTVRFKDAENDGPATLGEVQKPGVVRLASDPAIQVMSRTDPASCGTGGPGPDIIMQLCLDKVYAAPDFAIGFGFDIEDKAGHRSKAICVRQPSGG